MPKQERPPSFLLKLKKDETVNQFTERLFQAMKRRPDNDKKDKKK